MITNVSSLFLVVASHAWFAEDPLVLRPGDALEGTIEATDPVILTDALGRLSEDPVRGKTYRLEPTESGPFRVELRSHFFDAYLVVRSLGGETLFEDDNGLLRTHSRVTISGTASGPFLVDVGALHGGTGQFQVRVIEGLGEPLSPSDREEREITDVRESVDAWARVFGRVHPTTAMRLNYLASLVSKQGRHQEARPLYEEALRIMEAAEGPDHPNTATSLNNLAFELMSNGANEEAQPLFERSLRIREVALGPDHASTATCLQNLAQSLQAQGAHDEAQPLFERAIRIRKKQLGPDHRMTAISLSYLAASLEAQGAYAEARRLYERVLRVTEARLGPDHPKTATELGRLAMFLHDRGAYEQARPLYERALRIHEAALGPSHPATAFSLNNLGSLLLYQGAYEEARPLFERALRIQEAALGPDHPNTTSSLNNLALLHQYQGAFDDARRLYERAVQVSETSHGPNHLQTADCLGNLATMYQTQGRYEDALPILKRVLQIRELTLPPSHPKIATTLSNLAWLYKAGGLYEDARAMFERAHGIREAAFDPEHPDIAMGMSNLAHLEFDVGEVEAALVRSRSALERSEAHVERVLWSLSEVERLRFVRMQNGYRELLLSLARSAESVASNRGSYEAVLRSKGQVARSLLRDGLREVRSLPEGDREIVNKLRAVQKKLSDSYYATGNEDPDAHAARLKKLRAERNALEVQFARATGKAANRSDPSAPDLDAVVAALSEGTAAIDFLTHRWYEPAIWNADGTRERKGRHTEPHVSAWVLRRGEPLRQFDLGEAVVLEDALRVFLNGMVRRRGAPPALESDVPDPADVERQLFKLLWEPLADAVGDASSVVVSADSFLGTLPFETLVREDGSFLVEHHAFIYLADLASLPTLTVPTEEVEPTLFAAGGIDYWERAGLIEAAADDDGDSTRASESRIWPELDFTNAEVNTIKGLHRKLTGKEGVRLVLKGSDGTEERIKESIAGHTHVHLATHGFFHAGGLASWSDEDSDQAVLRQAEEDVTGLLPGLLSGLVFAGANVEPEPERENGLLTAEEITYLDLSDCDVVVLSACETGLGRPEGGEGMIGLRRAFRMAGARTVISSLWEVSDKSTRDLMTRFYENLWLKGMPKLVAFRSAQLSLLKRNREREGHALPSTWGAFVLDGAPN